MRKLKQMLLLFCVALLVTASLWLLSSQHSSDSDEGHLRDLRRCSRSYFRLNDLEHWLGFEASRVLGVNWLLRQYEHKADAARQALLASGYFIKVQATVTNLESRTEEINERFRHREGISEPDALTIYDTASDRVTVICRPGSAAAFEEALVK